MTKMVSPESSQWGELVMYGGGSLGQYQYPGEGRLPLQPKVVKQIGWSVGPGRWPVL